MSAPITKEDYDDALNAANARIALHKEALAWVLDNFNSFKQPPEHLKGIVDVACLRAMTADADMIAATADRSGVK